jgi:hypothetical protein
MLFILFKTYCISVFLSFIVTSFLLFDRANKDVSERNHSLSARGIILGTFVTSLLCMIPILNICLMFGTIKEYVNNW